MKLKNLVFALLLASLLAPAVVFAQALETVKSAVNPYVNLRLWGGYSYLSDERAPLGVSEIEFDFKKTAIIFLGFDVDQNNVGGKLELGMSTPTPADNRNNNVYLRHAYLTYNFGDLQLLAGQTGTPYTVASSQLSNGEFLNLGFGAAFDGRLPQIKATYKGAYIAIIQPSKTAIGSITNDYVKVIAPKAAIGYNYKSNAFNFGLGGAANMIQIDRKGGLNAEALPLHGEMILSYLAYANFGLNLDMFFAKVNATFGQNTGNFGIGHTGVLVPGGSLADKAVINAGGTTISNTYVIEGFIELGFKPSDMITLSGSVGYLQSTNDTFLETDRAIAYSAQCAVNIEKNFSIVPTVLYRDHMKDSTGANQGQDLYGGITFTASFK